jgi:hypothetical protein
MELKKLKVKKVTELKSIDVCDLTVSDAQHYITDNGVINHNTGPEYAASIILFLSKAKMKEGTNQTGIIVTAKPNKNRFAKPTPIKFHISFNKGMNPYIGLEEYISWDNCGIERGKFIPESQYEKLTESAKLECRRHSYTEGSKEIVQYFQPSQTARKIVVAHLNSSVELNELYTPKVFTDEVLNLLEPIVNKKFKYEAGGDLDMDNITEILIGETEESNEEND